MGGRPLLPEAADWFKSRDAPVERWYEDDRGRYAFRVTVQDQPFIVTAKKYLHGGDVSFMAQKVVQRAIDQDALLLQFVFEGGWQYVFDPEAVKEYGDPSDPDKSDRVQQGEDWLDLNVNWGVSFEDWVDGGKTPQRHTDQGERPDRDHDITAWGDENDD